MTQYKLEKCDCWNCKSYKEEHYPSIEALIKRMLRMINEKNDGYDWKAFINGEEVI